MTVMLLLFFQAQKHRLWDEDGDGVATTARERAHKNMAKRRLLDGVVRVATRPVHCP